MPPFNEQAMYDAETSWHLLFTPERQAKALAHWELIKMVDNVPGAIVECGVFKGTSFMRFAMMRKLLGIESAAKLVGFDVFSDEYPSTSHPEDEPQREHWINTAGPSSISVNQLESCLHRGGVSNFELVAGNAEITIPEYVVRNPGFRLSLLHLDIDFYEPTLTALNCFYDLMCVGGVVVVDNYAGEGTAGHQLHGDTQAIDDFFSSRSAQIRRFPFCGRPVYIVKE
jgi:hypothetical protein